MNFDLKEHSHYVVLAGSHAYGMATETSDLDVRGWCIPPKEYFTSFHKNFEQTQEKILLENFPWKFWKLTSIVAKRYTAQEPIDTVVYNVKKFFKLAVDCNPSIIELLFVDLEDIIFCDDLGQKVRDNAQKFLSARAKFTFSGYAISQLKRINTHRRWLVDPPNHKPERSEFGLPETSLISPDKRGAAESLIEKQARLWLLEEAEVDKTTISAIKDGLVEMFSLIMTHEKFVREMLSDKELMLAAKVAAAKKLKFDENYIAILQAEKRYRDKLTEWNQYQNWLATRNPLRAELEAKYKFDTKHGSHLVRLLLMAEEILTTGNLVVKRKDRAELLKEVRNGGWSYDEIVDWANKKDALLEDIYQNHQYVVPKVPPINFLDDLCQDITDGQGQCGT